MITGLKTRPTYDELINEIGEDPITRFQIEELVK